MLSLLFSVPYALFMVLIEGRQPGQGRGQNNALGKGEGGKLWVRITSCSKARAVLGKAGQGPVLDGEHHGSGQSTSWEL